MVIFAKNSTKETKKASYSKMKTPATFAAENV